LLPLWKRMFSRILTPEERSEIQRWMKADGERKSHVRTIATRGRQFVPQIRKDLELLERFLQAYDRT
jgi:hypothetical protein